MNENGNNGDGNRIATSPSAFKYLVGGSGLLIACCSAFFSVRGLGLLFIGSSVAVMIMATSLEIGKLVAASFLYRYWDSLNRALRFYLMVAVLLLIGITSLGNYGYLARAYERTHSNISMYEQKIAALDKEIADTQRQIDNSQLQLGKANDAVRSDETKLQEQIATEKTALEQSLARLQDRRKAAQERRDRDIQTQIAPLADRTAAFTKALAAADAVIAGLNDRLAVMDRSVDAYTKQGGATFFKSDGIRKGQDLRDEQREERQTIATQIAEQRATQEKIRADQAAITSSNDKEISAIRQLSAQELAKIDAEEQELRKTSRETTAQLSQQLTALVSQRQTGETGGGLQVETLHQRIRSRTDEIQRLRQQIAATDIGSYRFVARVFEAQADDVVKWLALLLVLVFDPLAVSLAIGFNHALLRDGTRPPTTGAPAPTTGTVVVNGVAMAATPSLVSTGRGSVLGAGLVVMAIAAGAGAIGLVAGMRALRQQAQVSHVQMIPADSFAVMTVRPAELQRSTASDNFPSWLTAMAGKSQAEALTALLSHGFDQHADVYAFAKFPTSEELVKRDRPVMLCGLVLRVTNPAAAETALFEFADRFEQKSDTARPNTALARRHMMINYGQGRYLDPTGRFFTFAIVDHSAILLLEFEGDPKSPTVENEIRARLAGTEDGTALANNMGDQLPARALTSTGAMTLWFDANRFFSALPKNPAAQARYQQLQAYLGFDVVLTLEAVGQDRCRVTADYAYQTDRFQDQRPATALQVLAALKPGNATGLSGQLMDRCADTLDFDSCIDYFSRTLAGTATTGVEDVLVEKSVTSPREARFVLTARCNTQAGPPLMAAFNAWSN
jgi:hypothetical protein